MCGIIGYVGKKSAISILLKGLKRMEYRGYDSAGLAVLDGKNKVKKYKAVGKVDALVDILAQNDINATMGIAHTRWATHGGVNEKNSHPHNDCHENFFVVHNGIIENYYELKEKLIAEGHDFYSETDTEVVAHLIEKYFSDSLEDAVIKAIADIQGTFGLVVISNMDPDKLVVARRSSPIVIGVGNGEYFVASDASAIVDYTQKIIYLDDNEIAVVGKNNVDFINLSKEKIPKKLELIEETEKDAEMGGYAHFMQKEICEQSISLKKSMAGRLLIEEGDAKLGGLELVKDKLEIKEKLEKLDINSISSKYCFMYFLDCYHPSYIVEICKYILDHCISFNLKVNPLWIELKASDGFITKGIIDNYGPQETDKGVV